MRAKVIYCAPRTRTCELLVTCDRCGAGLKFELVTPESTLAVTCQRCREVGLWSVTRNGELRRTGGTGRRRDHRARWAL